MSERLQTFLAVTVMTIAIWVWADLEQTKEGDAQMPVRVNVPADYVVLSVNPQQVLVTFRGPSGEIEKLKVATGDRECRFDLKEADIKEKRLVLKARDGFGHWSERVVPTDIVNDDETVPDDEVHVTLDHLVPITVTVQVQVTGAVAKSPKAVPGKVTARVLESELEALPKDRRFAVAAIDIETIPEDLQIEQNVTLDRHLGGPGGIEATFEPPIVKIIAPLESTVKTKSLGRFPILILAPPEVLNRYRIVFRPEAERWVELDVEGPGPAVERLKPQDVRVQLLLTEDDKPSPGSWLPREPVVRGLPPGVKVTKPVPLPTVNFNLEKQPESPPPTP
ncbi:MAG TPA: hypothetical protein VM431_10280 [Phycisphaerae bacterium]|nr:hypothetical protein [Phycisphaerae bacterium]